MRVAQAQFQVLALHRRAEAGAGDLHGLRGKPVETPCTMFAISARVVPHIMRACRSPHAGFTVTLPSSTTATISR